MISGGFKESPAYSGGEEARAWQPRQNWGTGVDPRHISGDQPDLGFPAPVAQRHPVTVPAALEDMFNLSAMPPTFDNPDHEPKGHDVPAAPWGVSDARSQEVNNALRQAAAGPNLLARTATKVSRGWSQTYSSERTRSLPPAPSSGPVSGPALRSLRGRNSLAVNNPGTEEGGGGNYTRQGYELNRWTPRRMPRRGLTHTKRELHLNLASVAQATDAHEGDDYSPYSSPFQGGVSRFTSGPASQMMRREPRPFAETDISEGDESDMAGYTGWGL